LGNVYYFPGNTSRLTRLREAWDIVERNPNEKWSDSWRQITRINEATLFQRLGRYQNALESIGKLTHLLEDLALATRRICLRSGARCTGGLAILEGTRQLSFGIEIVFRQHDADGGNQMFEEVGIVYALDRMDLAKAQRISNRHFRRATQSHNEREVMQGHMYLRRPASARSDDTRAPRIHTALAQAKKLETREVNNGRRSTQMGQIEELAGDAGGAEANYGKRFRLSRRPEPSFNLSALRAEFSPTSEMPMTALINLLLITKDVKEAFRFVERSRARTFQGRLASPKSGGTAPSPEVPDLDEVRSYLDLPPCCWSIGYQAIGLP